MIDAKAFGAELAGIVKAATVPILDRIGALEKRLDGLPAPRDGKDADPATVAETVRQSIAAELDTIRQSIDDIVIPEPVDLPDLSEMVRLSVEEAVSAIPAPENGADGKSVTADDIAPMIRAEVAKAVAAIPAPKDGVGLAGALIDRDGKLVVTLANGEAKSLGLVVGRDAEPGKPGLDGLGFDDLKFEADESGRPIAKFQRGEVVKSVVLPCIIDRGPFRAGDRYLKGDAVSYGGSLWIAQVDTADKPDGGAGWRLAVKKGRDGKDAVTKGAGNAH